MQKAGKKRLDILVLENGLASSREKARALIMSGVILVNGEREDKPGSVFSPDVKVTQKGKPLRYVSRGGLKLEKAIDVFGIDLKDRICFDAGASTGGFTDCMLQNGAAKVYAADVGYGQLDWKLRNDERVICMEKVNVRYLTPDMLNELCSFASIDVSFISLTLILPAVASVLDENGEIAALIKPQFEAGRENVGKKGVVRDKKIHFDVIKKIWGFTLEQGMYPAGLSFSPVKGPEGNIEYLLHIVKKEDGRLKEEDFCDIIKKVVEEAHDTLDRGHE